VTAPNQDTIEACLDRIKLAWKAGDARAYAGEFTEAVPHFKTPG
jgi:hypothetical protein